MDIDELLERHLRKMESDAISTEALSLATGVEQPTVNRRLKSMERYGIVKRKARRTVDFWGLG